MVVVSYRSASNVTVKFVDTGYITTTKLCHVASGCVKDRFCPSVFGAGFIGDGPYKSTKDRKAYQTWCGMLERCYCDKYQSKVPTYVGCSVSSDWLNFQSFASWFYDNYEDGLHIDKDILVRGNKIYSRSTCKFVTAKDNSIHASASSATLVSPSGTTTNIYNVSGFCRNKGLSQAHLSAVIRGKRKSHKGWRRA